MEGFKEDRVDVKIIDAVLNEAEEYREKCCKFKLNITNDWGKVEATNGQELTRLLKYFMIASFSVLDYTYYYLFCKNGNYGKQTHLNTTVRQISTPIKPSLKYSKVPSREAECKKNRDAWAKVCSKNILDEENEAFQNYLLSFQVVTEVDKAGKYVNGDEPELLIEVNKAGTYILKLQNDNEDEAELLIEVNKAGKYILKQENDKDDEPELSTKVNKAGNMKQQKDKDAGKPELLIKANKAGTYILKQQNEPELLIAYKDGETWKKIEAGGDPTKWHDAVAINVLHFYRNFVVHRDYIDIMVFDKGTKMIWVPDLRRTRGHPKSKEQKTQEKENRQLKKQKTEEQENPGPEMQKTREQENPGPEIQKTRVQENPEPKIKKRREQENPGPEIQKTRVQENPGLKMQPLQDVVDAIYEAVKKQKEYLLRKFDA